MVRGITGFGAYVPRMRLERTAIAAAHRWMAPSLKGLAKGARAFASWDEDAITMAVEAVRDALPPEARGAVADLTLASTTLPFADLSNSGIAASALNLPATAGAQDVAGSQRAGVSALAAAFASNTVGTSIVAASERPRAKPASTQEMIYGAGAAAFTFGTEGVIATLLGRGVYTAPFADHFRAEGVAHDYFWEERWIRDEGHAKLVPPAVKAALADADCAIEDIATLVFASPLKASAVAIAKRLKFAGAVAEAFDDGCGYAGAAHPLLMLAGALEKATPGQKILLIGFGQGAEALVLEATDAIAGFKPRKGVAGHLAQGVLTQDYLRMLSFYGEIQLDWGMRGEKVSKAALTNQYRETGQLAAFIAGKCRNCSTIQFPQLQFCVNPECAQPASQFEDYALTEAAAKVLTFTDDWLSYHPAPPLRVGFVQFEIGARLLMEMVDVGVDGIDIGTPLEMVFRIKEPDRVRSYNRYFWKAMPIASAKETV